MVTGPPQHVPDAHGKLPGMDLDTFRLQVTTHSASLLCTGCGHTAPVGRLHWSTLGELARIAEHACDSSADTHPATVTARSARPDVQRFAAQRLDRTGGEGVTLEDAYAAYRKWHELAGDDAPPLNHEHFSREMRKALPDVQVYRSMVNGVRARRFVGMSLL